MAVGRVGAVGGRLGVGIDVGGTKVEGLLVDVGASAPILDRRRLATPARDPEALIDAAVGVVRSLTDGREDVGAVGVGAAGMVSLDGVIRFAPNIAWVEFPLAERLGAELGMPVTVDNDANVAAWGEHRFGAGRGARHMLLVTVGTGIGGGIVTDGRLYRGAHGFAAEIGHVIVEPGGPRCGCGNQGCWETVASGRAIDRLGRLAAARDPDGRLAALALGDPEKATGPVVTRAAMEGDETAVGILAEVGRRLGEGIAGLVNVLDPEVVVVGGGAVVAGDLILEPARVAFAATVEAPAHRPPVEIRPAALGNDAGAVGAADLALASARSR